MAQFVADASAFHERLTAAQRNSLLCVGLDPDPERIPPQFRGSATPFLDFNRRIIDATFAIAAAYKPQIAFYSAVGAEQELRSTIDYVREAAPHALVILDAKRGDIGNTAAAYAYEAFDRFDADAVTINPYMGEDSVRPFLRRRDRGAALLCRTSNAGARDFQDLVCGDLPVYRHVAARAARDWNENRNLMLVVGATFPQEMAALRSAHPEIAFLVPGIGAQGGDLQSVLRAGLDSQRGGLLINAARSIIYAGGGEASAISAAAKELHEEIQSAR